MKKVLINVQDLQAELSLISQTSSGYHIIMAEWSLPRRYSVGPGRRFSLCLVSPAPRGPRMSWVLAPVLFALLHLEPSWALSVLSNSAHCPDSLVPCQCPSLRLFCRLPPDTPAAGPAPVPTESPQSHGRRSLGYSEGQRQAWSDCPVSNGCLWRMRRKR